MHVEMFVVHEVDDAEGFPEVGYADGQQGEQVQSDNVQQVSERDNLYPNVAVENARNESNSDDDSDDEEFLPFYLEVDSVDGIHFINNEEEYDDENGFEKLIGVKDGSWVDKGKEIVNGDFNDEEGFNSDELDLEYEVGGGSDKEDRQEKDDYKRRRYPIYKDVKDMRSYKWEVGTVFASREEFKDTVTVYTVQTRGLFVNEIVFFGYIQQKWVRKQLGSLSLSTLSILVARHIGLG
ncbi:uncharacterized protein LOC127743033 [Arachis duranensis]|uniref:Uncharacterized protein LOC127743033 n=1 Tax=Arachis duranensis TaxID=130453 RepID=A0A9C6TCQ5_ARADU|nr:uncharacterized protein LOC127743033 [Arachis duranensis]